MVLQASVEAESRAAYLSLLRGVCHRWGRLTFSVVVVVVVVAAGGENRRADCPPPREPFPEKCLTLGETRLKGERREARDKRGDPRIRGRLSFDASGEGESGRSNRYRFINYYARPSPRDFD